MARISYVSLGCPKALVDSERSVVRMRSESTSAFGQPSDT